MKEIREQLILIKVKPLRMTKLCMRKAQEIIGVDKYYKLNVIKFCAKLTFAISASHAIGLQRNGNIQYRIQNLVRPNQRHIGPT